VNEGTFIGSFASHASWTYPSWIAGLIVSVFTLWRLYSWRKKIREQEIKTQVEIRTLEIARAGEARSEFLAAISHEIRNPVNGIIGIVESFKVEGLDLDSRHRLRLLHQCAKHLSSLLEGVLDFSRFQPDGFKLDSKLFDVPELMESLLALTAAESEKCGIPVEIAVSPAVPRQLVGDPLRIRQILLNYVYNALKYSSQGKVTVTVWRNKTSPGFMEIFFAVSDEGPGISPAEQKNLFTRFERSASAQSRGLPGAGLGLFICKVLAEKMGGKVWLRSEAGQGSCFYFSAALATVDENNHAVKPAFAPIPPNLRNALVIDDEEYNRVALAGLLESLGLNVDTAANAQAALGLARNRHFDLVFIDYSIPGLDGPAIAREIRSLPGHSAKAKLFATTAFNTPEKRSTCLKAGMDAFLTKPITDERLRLALGAIFTTIKGMPDDSRSIPSDPLMNLRLLATKKGIPFKEELDLYFHEFEAEFKHLVISLQKEDPGRASYYAHLLYGRCSFINERNFEKKLRSIEATAATERWDEARCLGEEIQTQLGELRLKLFSDIPVVQPGSSH
jgi:signal transduction histidine kinase/DNA-binding response OmpR family regulator